MTVEPDDLQPEVFSARDINLEDIEEESLQGIVVLIGWEPFLVLYPVFRLLSTSIAEHITGGRIKKLLHRLDELVAAGNSGRLVFHTFSNTGWISFGGILESFGNALLPHICGAVIDSAPQPAVSHTVLAAGSFSALFPRAKYNKYDVRVIVIKNFLKMVVQGEKKRRWKAVAKLLYCLSDFPQLYIFSTSDHVIPSDSIKAWIKGQESLGRRVSELQIDSSPHVQHMRHHKELYCQALTSFLSELQLPSRGKFNQA
ncbi:probable transmembrane protein 53-B [Coccomyxa sp. Obi]|nr:probable transmembrane protein 53-B [Coccomyxa sp. Obi]